MNVWGAGIAIGIVGFLFFAAFWAVIRTFLKRVPFLFPFLRKWEYLAVVQQVKIDKKNNVAVLTSRETLVKQFDEKIVNYVLGGKHGRGYEQVEKKVVGETTDEGTGRRTIDSGKSDIIEG